MTSRSVVVAIALILGGCSKREPAPGAAAQPNPASSASAQEEHSDEPAHDELPTRVRLPKNVIDDAKLRTAPAVREHLAATLSLPGEIVADPDRSARVVALVPGRVTQVSFKEGSVVKKGQVLATVRVPELGNVRAALGATQGKAVAARTNADRLQVLTDKGLASSQEALAAHAEAAALEGEARGLRDQLASLGSGTTGAGSELTLRAPLAGVVVARSAILGQAVAADETIAAIADLSEVLFIGRVFEMDLGHLQVGATAEVALNAYSKERFVGTIEYLGRQIDPVARTVTARIRLANRAELLRIGLFGTAQVEKLDAQQKSPVLVVATTAVTEIGGKSVVFVRQADDDFELHAVVLGESALGKVEVVSGLREGEQVVVEGVFTLKSAVLKSTIAEEE